MTWLLRLALLLMLAATAQAVEPAERLADPAMEARARTISTGLRCVVCQNETIDDSNAGLARDIRRFLRERLVAGDTDAQAVDQLVARYGDFVLLRPPVKPATWLLWFGPAAVLVLGLGGTAMWLGRRPRQAEIPEPLSASEAARVERLLKDDAR